MADMLAHCIINLFDVDFHTTKQMQFFSSSQICGIFYYHKCVLRRQIFVIFSTILKIVFLFCAFVDAAAAGTNQRHQLRQ